MKIAIIAEYDSRYEPHIQTDEAIEHAAQFMSVDVNRDWISTADLSQNDLKQFDALWFAPGSPYKDLGRTLETIQYARTSNVPCLGTCGGFQHMVIEFARNVIGISDAQHAEYDPYASKLIVSKLECSLAGREMEVTFTPGSSVAQFYDDLNSTERYYCNFGVNPEFVSQLSEAGFRVVGADTDGECRVMEVSKHPFFVGTLYVPQAQSKFGNPHPLVCAFVRVARSTIER